MRDTGRVSSDTGLSQGSNGICLLRITSWHPAQHLLQSKCSGYLWKNSGHSNCSRSALQILISSGHRPEGNVTSVPDESSDHRPYTES